MKCLLWYSKCYNVITVVQNLCLTVQCRKTLEGFLVGYRAEKCHFLGEFGRILGSKRSLAVCTTVVQLGILRLTLYI